MRDFQPAGVATRGCSFQKLKTERLKVMGKRIAAREHYRKIILKY